MIQCSRIFDTVHFRQYSLLRSNAHFVPNNANKAMENKHCVLQVYFTKFRVSLQENDKLPGKMSTTACSDQIHQCVTEKKNWQKMFRFAFGRKHHS